MKILRSRLGTDLLQLVKLADLKTVRRCRLQVWAIPPPVSLPWPKKKISTLTTERQRFGLQYTLSLLHPTPPFGDLCHAS